MLKALFIVAALLSLFSLLIYTFQVKMIFLPQILSPQHRFVFSHPFEEHWIDVPGAKINALLFEQESDRSRGLVVYFHGNAGSLESWGDVHQYFLPAHYDTFVVDYRGYGKSTGSIGSEAQLLLDAEAIYAYVLETFGDRYQDRVILYGRSIGTGIASWLARRVNPSMLILETPYIDLPSLVRELYPFIPRFAVRYKLNNQEHLRAVNCPVHIFHGTHDGLIPYQHGEYLSRLSTQIELHTIVGGEHNDLPTYRDYHRTLRRILQ